MKRLIILIIILAFPVMTWAATYYVQADGEISATEKETATGCGADTSMNVTEFNKVTDFSAGDTIYFCSEGGDYVDSIIPASDGSTAANIVYDGDPGGTGTRAKIDGTANSLAYGVRFNNVGAYSTVQNFEICDCSSSGISVISTTSNLNRMRILHNKIHDITDHGIYIQGTDDTYYPDSPEIGHNEIYDCGVDTGGNDISVSRYATNTWIHHNALYATGTKDMGVDGILMNLCAKGTVIEFNTIYNHNFSVDATHAGEDGIDLKRAYNATATQSDTWDVIRYNTIYGHTNQSAITIHYGSQYVKIYGNRLYGNLHGIDLSDAGGLNARYVNIYDNLIYENDWNGIQATTGFIGDAYIYNNVIYNNGDASHALKSATGLYLSAGATYVVKNNIFANNRAVTATFAQLQWAVADVVDETTTFDNNLYYDSRGAVGMIWNGGATMRTFAYIQTAYPPVAAQEASGTGNTDPQFMDATNYVFAVKPGSPAIRKGDTTYNNDIGLPYVEGQHLMQTDGRQIMQ